ncbi:MAG: TniQ family protein, partial [Lachnospiraceae bacterium]|nr:TniQ family protein [Lachnospiraceae bacterium]
MIGFMPAIYPDELVYSWFCRYYAHSGHSAYVFAKEDILQNRHIRTDIEFINRLNDDFRSVVLSMIPMEELILSHTMFPYYRFAGVSRLYNALKFMASKGEDAHRLLPIQKGHPDMQSRYIKYCPQCTVEARNIFGEAYWSRKAVMRHIDVCVKHGCRLKDTDIAISGKQSGRLYVAEEKIDDMEPETVKDGLEFTFAKYMADAFHRPICFDNDVPVGEFLRSRLVGTKYMSARGMQMQTSILVDDIMGFYKEIQKQVSPDINAAGGNAFSPCITQKHHIQHILTGKCSDFYKICQLAFFLGITVDELVNPEIPKINQTMIFDNQVRELYAQGLGCYRIARKLGCSAATARHVNKPREKKPHDYSAARLGKQKMDWDQLDMDMLSEVQKAAEQIYGGKGQRPKR